MSLAEKIVQGKYETVRQESTAAAQMKPATGGSRQPTAAAKA